MDALKRLDAVLAIPEVCRELDISSATFYPKRDSRWSLWRAKYGGVEASMIARMKELEAENTA